jgi:ABC-2 type transport system ATP-binding protein
VLQSLSLDIYQNEIFCLLGPNGAGKTTLMNILSGMATKTKGKISIMG